MTKLLEQVTQIREKYDELNRISGENFNILRTMGLTSDEVKVHSKFITELLKPDGSHGQGNIFLKLFVEQLKIKDFETENAKAVVEKNIGRINEEKNEGGQLDIYIEDSNGKTIIIENKIYAGDQKNQLLRYYKFNKDNILYLTLDGKEPSKGSVGTLTKDNYSCISYKNDITLWLENCRKEAATLPLLREGISHYINLIKYLTGQTINKTMKTEIVNQILSNSDTLKSALTIEDSLNEAKAEIQWRFWDKLQKSLEKVLHKKAKENLLETVEKKEVKKYYHNSKNNKNYKISFQFYEDEKYSYLVDIKLYNNIYCVFSVKNINRGKVDLNKFSKQIEYLTQIEPKSKSNKSELGWIYTNPKLDFRNFSQDEILSFADDEKLGVVVTKIIKELSIHIESFTEMVTDSI